MEDLLKRNKIWVYTQACGVEVFGGGGMTFFNDLFGFLFSKRSRLVLIPFLAVILLFAAVFVVLANSAWSPFVYAVF